MVYDAPTRNEHRTNADLIDSIRDYPRPTPRSWWNPQDGTDPWTELARRTDIGPLYRLRLRVIEYEARVQELDIWRTTGPTSPLLDDLNAAFDALVRAVVWDDHTATQARPHLTADACAERCGITRGTWGGYVSRGQLPGPIGYDWITGRRVWDAAIANAHATIN